MSYRDEDIRRVAVSVAASTTDGELWPAESGRSVRLLSAFALATAATALTFNTKGTGAGVALTPAFASADGHPTVAWQPSDYGWLQTNPGEGLTVTTGSGQATKIIATFVLQAAQIALWDVRGIELLAENGGPLLLEAA